MAELTHVSIVLTTLGIPHREFVHTGEVTSLEQAAAERGQTPGQVVRSIVFRLGEGRFAMVLIAGTAQISWPTLRAHFGQSRLTMADPEEVLRVTGYRTGTVSPIGLLTPMPILVDESLLALEELSIGSGRPATGVIMKRDDLLRAIPNGEVGKFSASR